VIARRGRAARIALSVLATASLVLDDPCFCLTPLCIATLIHPQANNTCSLQKVTQLPIMPRQLKKAATASAARSSSKRPSEDTLTRHSKRARPAARKSYAEPDSDDDDEEDASKKPSRKTDEDDVTEASDFEVPGDEHPSSESEQEEAPTSDEDVKPKKGTPRGQAAKKSLPLHSKQGDEKELWRPGAKLAPGTQLIIKKPKAREAGATPFTDDTIHPNTMLFLKDLAANNDRQWLKCTLDNLVKLARVGV
jgi:hypothetical protein